MGWGVGPRPYIPGITYADGDPFVTAPVTVVPEPSTWAAILGGAGLLGLVQRRRRKV